MTYEPHSHVATADSWCVLLKNNLSLNKWGLKLTNNFSCRAARSFGDKSAFEICRETTFVRWLAGEVTSTEVIPKVELDRVASMDVL